MRSSRPSPRSETPVPSSSVRPSEELADRLVLVRVGHPLAVLDRRPHRSFATIGLDAGVDVLHVAELLGHSFPAITMSVYEHVRRDRMNASMAQITAAIET